MAGTVTAVEVVKGSLIHALRLTVVADAADATIPDTVLPKFSGKLIALLTDPGATAPTANYDITIVDALGFDVLEGVGANRHTSNSEKVAIVYAATTLHPPVAADDVLTLNIDNNAVNSAEITIALYFEGAFA